MRKKYESLPRYRELGRTGSAPPGAAWSVFGGQDEIGTINLQTPESLLKAAQLVRQGKLFSLNWSLEQPGPAILGRKPIEHRIVYQEAGLDDYYEPFFPQISSQWDSLAHVKHPEYGFYNGFVRSQVDGSEGSHLGIHNWARRGIAGRFVLIDIERHYSAKGTDLDCSQRLEVSVADLEEVLDAHDLALSRGDVLLIRFGWIAWYESQSLEARRKMASGELFNSPGLSATEETAEWLWDSGVSAVAADCPALEAMPFDASTSQGFLHYRLIPLLGMALGEMFDLETLAEDSSKDGVYEGLFTAAPLNKTGGIGSPANALAIK